MSLKDQLKEAQKDAMRAKDKLRLGTIRMALAAVKQIEVDDKKELNDEEVTAVLTKAVKQRHDSVKAYIDAGRDDLAQVETDEISVLESFLPEKLSNEELVDLVEAAIANASGSGMQDMGKVMGVLKPQVQGRADMGQVSQLVKAKLTA